MWPNFLGAVRKAGTRCPHQLVVVGGKHCDGGGAGGVLSTFYVLMDILQNFKLKNIEIVPVLNDIIQCDTHSHCHTKD